MAKSKNQKVVAPVEPTPDIEPDIEPEDGDVSVADAQVVAPVAETEPEKATGSAVTVEWRGNKRVFSKAVHGADFRKLAEQFAAKFNGQLV